MNNVADIHLQNTNQQSPFYGAAAVGNIDAMKCLVKLGADINVLNEDGETPFR